MDFCDCLGIKAKQKCATFSFVGVIQLIKNRLKINLKYENYSEFKS